MCLDYTGSGVGLGDYLVDEFGEYKPAADRFGKLVAEGSFGLFVVTNGVDAAAGFPGVEGQRGEGAAKPVGAVGGVHDRYE